MKTGQVKFDDFNQGGDFLISSDIEEVDENFEVIVDKELITNS